MSEQQALEFIICFYIKASEGDESQFLTVGGNTENELSALFVKAQRIINMRQPSVGVLVSEATSSNLMEEAKELAQNGGGMRR